MSKYHVYPEEYREIDRERRLRKVWDKIGKPGAGSVKDLCREAIEAAQRKDDRG